VAVNRYHPVSFLFDPQTRATTDFTTPDVWLPTVDPSGKVTVYWAGTVIPDEQSKGWRLGVGHLVLDRWSASAPDGTRSPSAEAGGSDEPDASAEPRESSGTGPGASATPVARAHVGPSGTGTELVGNVPSTFAATFDPSGTRLALWVADPADSNVGTLQLVVLDASGQVDPKQTPLPSVSAVRGFSIDAGRLAWVTPPGQNGEQSVVQVLAWSQNEFGKVQTIPAEQLFIVG
jgi:hypothetical protein